MHERGIPTGAWFSPSGALRKQQHRKLGLNSKRAKKKGTYYSGPKSIREPLRRDLTFPNAKTSVVPGLLMPPSSLR